MRCFYFFIAIIFFPFSSISSQVYSETIPQYLQDISVTIQSSRAQGSGVYKVTKDGTVWVLTCGHVVEDLRQVREVLDGKGGKKTAIEFEDALIKQFISEDGRLVGETNYSAEIIRYSDAYYGEDLAVLRLRTKKFKPASAKFYLEKKIPAIGVDLIHCGSLLGSFGSNSITTGIVSQHGRVFQKKVYDQTTCVSYPGSSGGVVALKEDGRYVGMIVRGAVGGFNLVVPIRRIHAWCEKNGMDFILDDSKEVPTEEKLRSFPIECESGEAGLNSSAAPRRMPDAEHKFLIYPLKIKSQ